MTIKTKDYMLVFALVAGLASLALGQASKCKLFWIWLLFWTLIYEEAVLLAGTGIEVIAVGVGEETNQKELTAMVLIGKVVNLKDYQQASEYINELSDEACQTNAYPPF